MCEDYYHWDIDEVTGFRKIVLHINNSIEKENNKFKNWKGKFRNCSKCKKELPECTYFFNSGGKNKFHRYCKKCEGSPSYKWGRKYNYNLNEKGYHYCSGCDRVLPLNILYFNKTKGKNNRTGYSSSCKECTLKNGGFGLHRINEYRDILNIKINYKICSKCSLELPDDDFYFFKKNDRLSGMTICKKCNGHEWGIYRPNKVLKNEIPDGYSFCNTCENIKSEEKMANLSLCKNCAIPKRKEYNQRPEVKEAKRIFAQKRRSMKKGLRNDLTHEEYLNTLEYFKYSCSYCGFKPKSHYELQQDHIHPISKGGEYTKNNIIPACESCNKAKNNKSIDEFFDYKEEFSVDRYRKITEFINFYS